MKFHSDPVQNEIIFGWLHLMYHIRMPHLYTPARAMRSGCRFCPDAYVRA